MSTTGAAYRFCESAEVGQTRTAGQGWFSGQRFLFTYNVLSPGALCSRAVVPVRFLKKLFNVRTSICLVSHRRLTKKQFEDRNNVT